MLLHEALAHCRKEKGISQLELAEELNVSRQAISKWETGAAIPSTDNLILLSELYGISLDHLVKGDVPAPPAGKTPPQDTAGVQEMKEEIARLNHRLGRKLHLLIAAVCVLAVCVVGCLAYVLVSQRDDAIPIEEFESEVVIPTEFFDIMDPEF